MKANKTKEWTSDVGGKKCLGLAPGLASFAWLLVKSPSVRLSHINWGSFFYMARTGKPGMLMPPWPWCMPHETLAAGGDVVDAVSSPYSLLMLS